LSERKFKNKLLFKEHEGTQLSVIRTKIKIKKEEGRVQDRGEKPSLPLPVKSLRNA